MSITSYKELIVWQKAMSLVHEVYKFSSNFPEYERFGLTSQINRAVVSIPSNIAEGWGRGYHKNFVQFLKIARGSLYELETQVLIAKELYSIDSENIDGLINEISKMLNTLIKKLEEKE